MNTAMYLKIDMLEKAIGALEKASPEAFSMYEYVHPCGTPACVLGNMAHQGLLPGYFISNEGGFVRKRDTQSFELGDWSDPDLMTAFVETEGVPNDRLRLRMMRLCFGSCGCSSASTPEQAIAYLRRCIKRHGVPPEMSISKYLDPEVG